MKNRARVAEQATVILVAFGLLLAGGPLAAADTWSQTDWSGGRGGTAPPPVVTGTTTGYATGENENVATAGKIIIENEFVQALANASFELDADADSKPDSWDNVWIENETGPTESSWTKETTTDDGNTPQDGSYAGRTYYKTIVETVMGMTV